MRAASGAWVEAAVAGGVRGRRGTDGPWRPRDPVAQIPIWTRIDPPVKAVPLFGTRLKGAQM